MHGYVPGLQKNDSEIIKLNSNENPYPPSPAVFEALEALADDTRSFPQKYPSPTSRALRAGIEDVLKLQPGSVLAGNGSDEVLALLFRGLMDPGQSFVMPDPTYSLYPILARATGLEYETVPVKEDFRIDLDGILRVAESANCKVAIMAMPNAPTGIAEDRESLTRFIEGFPGWVVLDEAYSPFSDFSFMQKAGTDFPNLICTCTFSKAWSLAGMRVGWMVAHPDLIAQIDKIRDSYNLNMAAQSCALAAIRDTNWQSENATKIKQSREKLIQDLNSRGFQCIPSAANFVLARVPDGSAEQARHIEDELEKRSILIRYFAHDRITEYLRISVGTPEQMERLLQALDQILTG